MNSSIDLNLLLTARRDGEDLVGLPDLYASAPTRRAAHGREADSLIIYLSLTGNSPLNPGEHAKLLEGLAQKFYKTTGSLTAALRTIAEALNDNLLDRNLRSTSAGRQGIGQLLLLALRADTLYIAQSGAVQAYQVKPGETQPIYDLQTSGRGLGLSRSTPVRYLQIKLSAGEFLVLSTIPAAGWSDASPKHPQKQGIESLQHALEESGGQEFNAVIVQAQAGTGKLNLLRRKAGIPAVELPPPEALLVTAPPVADAQPMADTPQPSIEETAVEKKTESIPTPAPADAVQAEPAPALAAGVTAPAPPPGRETPLPPTEISVPAASAVITPSQVPSPPATAAPKPVKTSPEKNTSPKLPAAPSQAPQKQKTFTPTAWAKFLVAVRMTLAPIFATILRAIRTTLAAVGTALLRLLKNLLPDADVLRLPPSTMVFIAIAIPLVLAVLGGMVFLQRGQAQQHQIYYQQAVDKAAYAATLDNPLEQRLAYQTTLGELDKAEEYTVTSQSQALRAEVTTKLDALDSVKRLDYKQAIVNGLDAAVKVTRIVASAADLYLLDGNQGIVLHAVMTSRGYELDPTFKCGPTQGPIDVGPLVDIVELPLGGYENASLLGIDANSNLLYCVVGAQPYSASLAPPNTGLGSPVGMSQDRGDLYVLDPTMNAVWIYRNLEVSQPPRFYFGEEVPPMQDVIDLEVYNDDLYMLNADGHTTKCTYSGMSESPTRCEDPYPYSDNRPGRSHGPVIEDAVFSQMDYITFPERSIFYLDPHHQAIYYFSVLLTLQYQFQPKSPLAQGESTSFAISANRIAFLAVGNNVYYAAMP